MATALLAILLLGGDPERDLYASRLAFDFAPPLTVFASSPGRGAEERLEPVARAKRLVLSYEAWAHALR